jgi:hypothetical protein
MPDNQVQLIIHRVKPGKGPYETVKIPSVPLHAIPQLNDNINFDWAGDSGAKGKVTDRWFGIKKTDGDHAEFNRVEIFADAI